MGRPTKRGMPTLRRFRTVLVLAAVVATAASANAGSTPATYYVSPSGSDTNAGTAAAPWKTVARVNRASLSPGDTVLFQGGAAFSDQPLMPPTAGTSSSPITFSSYGTGQAQITNANGAVWLPSGDHDLVFDNLDLSSSNSVVFAAAGSGTGAAGIVVQNSTVHDSPYSGVVVQPQDSSWTVHGNTFRHLGDCGLLVQGPNVTIDRNTITDTGWNTSLTYAKHGIYAKGAAVTISNNDISSAANGQAISLRFAGARVFGNTIHDTPYAIGFFPQEPVEHRHQPRLLQPALEHHRVGVLLLRNGAERPAGRHRPRLGLEHDCPAESRRGGQRLGDHGGARRAREQRLHRLDRQRVSRLRDVLGAQQRLVRRSDEPAERRRGQPPRPAPVGRARARPGELLPGRR